MPCPTSHITCAWGVAAGTPVETRHQSESGSESKSESQSMRARRRPAAARSAGPGRLHELHVAVRVAPLSAKFVCSAAASVDTLPALHLPNIVFVQGAESDTAAR